MSKTSKPTLLDDLEDQFESLHNKIIAAKDHYLTSHQMDYDAAQRKVAQTRKKLEQARKKATKAATQASKSGTKTAQNQLFLAIYLPFCALASIGKFSR